LIVLDGTPRVAAGFSADLEEDKNIELLWSDVIEMY
jgi:hypothetical protein